MSWVGRVRSAHGLHCWMVHGAHPAESVNVIVADQIR